MLNKKLMILTIILVSLLTVSAVSAADNATEDVVSIEETDAISVDETDEVVSVEDNQEIIGNESDVGTFDELSSLIANTSEGKTLKLDKDYKYVNGSDGGIQINKAITIDGKGHTIDGNKDSRIFKIGADKVILKNIVFKNGSGDSGSALFWNGAKGDLINCSFEDCYSSWGGAVYWNDSDGVLANCSFEDCYSSWGGAVYWNDSDGVLANCSFEYCSSDSGGAVYWNSSGGVLANCSFENCFSNWGGAVYWNSSGGVLANCSFLNCNCFADSGYNDNYCYSCAGAVYWNGNDGVLANCSFENCFSNWQGAVYWDGANGVLANCSFLNCNCFAAGYNDYYCYSCAGAICWCGDNGTITNCSFVNCYSSNEGRGESRGGAIYFEGINGNVSGCSFLYCYCYNDGHSLGFNPEDYDVDYYFDYIHSDSYGGAVYWWGDNGCLYDCSFIGCTVSGTYGNSAGGGAIYWVGGNGKIDNSYFSKFNAGFGKAVYASRNAIISNSRFESNTLDDIISGGIVSNCTFAVVPKIIAYDLVTTYGNSEKFTVTLKDENGTGLESKNITVNIGTISKTLPTDSNGQVSIDISTLIPNTYTAKIVFAGDEIYAKSDATAMIIIINKKSTEITASDITTTWNVNKNLVISLKDNQNSPVAGVQISVDLGSGAKYYPTDSNGQVNVSTEGLAPGSYVADISFDGSDDYEKSNATAKITINKESTILTATGVTTTYNINNPFVIVLKDNQNSPLANTKVGVDLGSGVKYYPTDSSGQVKVATGTLAPKTYNAKVTFAGDSKYGSSSATAKVVVKKATPKMTAKAKTFKKSVKTKKYTITLKTNQNNVMKNTKVTIKVNKKTYSAKTNSKGVATFKITKLTKKGKYTATVTFNGNTYYNKLTKKVKITVK